MEPLTIEVRCLLNPNDLRWNNIETITLEIGYPGLSGQILWKHIAWIQEPSAGFVRTFAHAIWARQTADSVLVFEFMPVLPAETGRLEKKYCYRVHQLEPDGYLRRSPVQSADGAHQNDLFLFTPCYPAPTT